MRRRVTPLAIALLWLVIPFLPATSIVFTVATVIAERLLYIPSVGVCLAAGHFATLSLMRVSHHSVLIATGISLAATATLLRSRDWSSEERLFAAAIEAYPTSSKAHFAYGNAVRFAGRSEESIPSYKEASRLFPAHSDAYLNWGIALSNIKKPEDSLKLLNFALRLDPKAVDAYEQIATIFFNHNDPNKAVKALDLAQRIAPLSYHALNVKGAAQLTLGDTAGAKDSFRHSAGKMDHPETYNNWGILLQRDGEHAQAIQKFGVASELRPTFAQPLFNIGMSFTAIQGLDSLAQAVEQFQKATRLDGVYARAYGNMAHALHRLGKAEVAKEALQMALKLDPENAETHQHASNMGYKLTARP